MLILSSTRAADIFICNFFFFNDTATTEIYTLSLHDALPICRARPVRARRRAHAAGGGDRRPAAGLAHDRSEEHTSELQSRPHLVCRLLLEKKKKKLITFYTFKKKNKKKT